MANPLARLDDALARFEKAAVLVLLAVMAAVVFLSVVHRVSASADGLILSALTILTPGSGSPAVQGFLRGVGVPVVAALLCWTFCYAGLRTRSGSVLSVARAALVALAITAGVGVGIVLMHLIFPNGFVWSQPLALGLLLWVALIGGTLATKAKAHIILEIADRIWPPAALRYTRLITGFVAGAFCLCMTVLGAYFMWDAVERWQMGTGYIAGVPVPLWAVYLSTPVCFALMGLRFLGYAVADFLSKEAPVPTPLG